MDSETSTGFVPRANIIIHNFNGQRGKYDGNALGFVRQMEDWFKTLEASGTTVTDSRKINEFGLPLVDDAKLWYYSIRTSYPTLTFEELLGLFAVRYHPSDYNERIIKIIKAKKQLPSERTRDYAESMASLHEKLADPGKYKDDVIKALKDNCHPMISFELFKSERNYRTVYDLIKVMCCNIEILFPKLIVY